VFLADRNILADQTFNVFSAFPEDALKRIEAEEIKKTGKVLTNGSIFLHSFSNFYERYRRKTPLLSAFKRLFITDNTSWNNCYA
jgi:type I site-specific restriction-modification system R (restriction) subunit